MRIEIEKKIIEQENNVYIADDGTEFTTQHDCEKYEKEQEKKAYIELAETLRIAELDEQTPLTCGETYENNTYRWYKVNNQEEFDALNKAYDNQVGTACLISYPQIICVETCGYEPYQDDCYSYFLSDCLKETGQFWKLFGYDVNFTKSNTKYKVKLVMSEEYTIDAQNPEEAEKIAREKFGCDYYIDEVVVKEIGG